VLALREYLGLPTALPLERDFDPRVPTAREVR
jgi:hypothetical protein